MPFSCRYSHLSPPSPGSSSNSPCRLSLVVWEMCTLLCSTQTSSHKKHKKSCWLTLKQKQKSIALSPRNPPRLHLIGHGDVCGPDVKLPPLLAEHSSQHGAGVDAHAHVHLGSGLLSHVPGGRGKAVVGWVWEIFSYLVFLLNCVGKIVSHLLTRWHPPSPGPSVWSRRHGRL